MICILAAFLRIACLALMFCLQCSMLYIKMPEVVSYLFLDSRLCSRTDRIIHDQMCGEGIDGSTDGPYMYMVYVPDPPCFFDHITDLIYIYVYRYSIQRQS